MKWADLLTAFEELNPDPACEILAKLQCYLSEEDIGLINNCIDNFDFDAAANETKELAKKLGANMGDSL